MASFSSAPRPPGDGPLPASGGGHRMVWGVCILLTVLVWAVFGQTLNHEFVNYDDNGYVYDNALVKKGLSFGGVRQAFTHRELGLWNPLNTLSHMVDIQLYGLNPAGHHLTNVLLHLASVLLLFLVLRRLTGSLWRSAFVAAVFAIHPLRVESVAWISERKDVLSGLFFMLTLGAYLHYLKGHKSLPRYGILIGFFGLGLMSKPMLVTVPFVLLLIDYWPLNRLFRSSSAETAINWPVVWEKLPLMALSAALVFSFLVGPPGESPEDPTPLAIRLAQMPLAFVAYLVQMLWPVHLTLIYPPPEGKLIGLFPALALICTLTWTVFHFRKKYPYLLTGWLWNMGMLVPVSGIIQVSRHWQADHYTYLPQIGIYLMVAWGMVDLGRRWHCSRLVLGTLATLVLVALLFTARTQTVYWGNSYLLWTHMLACGGANEIAYNNLAMTLRDKGDTDGAIQQYEEALLLKPDYMEAHYNLANVLRQKGKVDEAIGHYEKALALNPRFSKTHNNFGNALLREGKVDEAIGHYETALALNPAFAEAHFNLGSTLLIKGGRTEEALEHYRKALEIQPDDAEVRREFGEVLLQEEKVDEAIVNFQKVLQIRPLDLQTHNNLAIAFYQKGKLSEAIGLYKKTVELDPGNVEAQNNLAWLLAAAQPVSLRNGILARSHAQKANELSGGKDPMILRTLAAAFAEEGNFQEAIKVARGALGLARAQSDGPLVGMLGREIRLYQAGVSFREADSEKK